jgi:hypothetical protein
VDSRRYTTSSRRILALARADGGISSPSATSFRGIWVVPMKYVGLAENPRPTAPQLIPAGISC